MLLAKLFALTALTASYQHSCRSAQAVQQTAWAEEKKRKDYTLRRHSNEKPSIMMACPNLD